MEKKFYIEKDLRTINGTVYLHLPKEILDYLELNGESKVNIMPDYSKKYGRYVGIWSPEQQENKKDSESD